MVLPSMVLPSAVLPSAMTATVGRGAPWRTDVPVTPTREQARAWAAQELAHREYAQSLTDRIFTWVIDRLNGIHAPGVGSGWGMLVLLVVVAIVVVVAVWLGRSGLRRSRAGVTIYDELTDTSVTADQYRAQARQAAQRGEWEVAVLARFRAVVRSLEERTVLDARPGRTADEAARDAAGALPQHSGRLREAATTFDAILYGGRRARAAQYEELSRLDDEIASTRLRPAMVDASPGTPS